MFYLYDLILDTKTNRSIFEYLRVLNPHCTYVTVGGSTIRLFQALFLGSIIRMFNKKLVCLVGLKPNKDLDYINELFKAGKYLDPLVTGIYALA